MTEYLRVYNLNKNFKSSGECFEVFENINFILPVENIEDIDLSLNKKI